MRAITGTDSDNKDPALARIVGIDIARSVAILLAMASHVWTVSLMGDFFQGSWAVVLKLTMAASTPTFIILFGTMLEIVYFPRFRPGQKRKTSAKLLSRALQCWILYSLSVAVLFLVRTDYSARFSIATVMMMGVTPFTDILKFYAIVLAISPILLLVRNQIGLAPLVIAGLAIHLAYPALVALPTPTELSLPVEVGRIWKFLFGLGDVQLGGPSVLRGITLVIAGMAFGRILISYSTDQRNAVNIRNRAAIILIVSGIFLAVFLFFLDSESMRNLGNMTLRIAGHPLYFLFSLLASCVLTSAAVVLTAQSNSHKFWRDLAFFGRTSLFTFAFGNMLLYLVTLEPTSASTASSLALSLVFAIIALSMWFDWTMRRKGWLADQVIAVQRTITAGCEAMLGRLASAFG